MQWAALATLVTFLFMPLWINIAMAQVVVTPGPSPTVPLNVTATTVVIAALSVLVGFVSQAISTGTFLGVIPLPPAWVPYLTLFGTFLTAFVASITATTVTGAAAWVNALLAGFMALTGAAGGITAHQHISAPKITRMAAANDNAASAPPKAA
jgi:hypothetical protein